MNHSRSYLVVRAAARVLVYLLLTVLIMALCTVVWWPGT